MDLDKVFSQLIRIDGLDIWDGLAHVGCNKEVYADALRLFYRDLENKHNDIKKFLRDEKWKDYTAALHAIKGGLAGIGAWELSQKAKELEDAARNEDYEFCRKNSSKVLKKLVRFTGKLKSSALFAGVKTEREQVSIDYLKEKLGELYQHCSTGNSEEAEALAKELKTKVYGGSFDIVNVICTHVENLDYHLALLILAEQPYIKNSVVPLNK